MQKVTTDTNPIETLENLVKTAQGGNREAFEALVQRHCGMVYSIGFARLKNREAAEDLVQEVFVRIHLNLDKLAEPRFFTTWLSRIARNLATDWARRNQRSSALLTMVPLPKSSQPIEQIREHEVRATLEEKQRAESANAAIMSLPDEQREIVMLHYSEGMTLKEIAAIQGVHPATVGRQLNQALDVVRTTVLEPLVRDSSRVLGAPTHLAARTVATAAVVASLSGEAKTAFAAAAHLNSAMQAAQPVAASAGKFTAAVNALLSVKGAAVAAAVVAVVGAGAVVNQSQEPATQAALPNSAGIVAAAPDKVPPGIWPTGTWMGTLDFGDGKTPIHVVYTISQDSDGHFIGRSYSPDQGFGAMRTLVFDVTSESFHLTNPGVNAEFMGRKKGSNEIEGRFKQGGYIDQLKLRELDLPLVVRRVEALPADKLLKPVISSEPQTLKEFAGLYASDPQVTAGLTLDEKGLIITGTHVPPTHLLQESTTDFRFEEDPVFVSFGRNASGQIDRVSFRIEIAGLTRKRVMRKLQ